MAAPNLIALIALAGTLVGEKGARARAQGAADGED